MTIPHVPYIERTRTYYATLGYPAYEWAKHDEVSVCAHAQTARRISPRPDHNRCPVP